MAPSSILGVATILKKEIVLGNLKARSNNGLLLEKNNLVLLTGEIVDNPVAGYVDAMILLLNNGEQYTINNITYQNEKFCISTAGWNWDCRNITKVTNDNDNIQVPDPVIFDPNNLNL